MKKIINSLVISAVLLFVVSAGAFAAFSSQSVNKGNIITTGTLILQVDTDPNVSGNQTGPIFDLTDFKAGNSVIKQVFVKNIGSLNLSYNGYAAKSAGEDILYSSLILKVGTIGGSGNLYDGALGSFGAFITGGRNLSVGVGENLYYTLSLPVDADQTLEGKTLSVNFGFNATQSP